MPVGQTLSSAAHGAVFGLFPILWIVVNALWVYRMTVRTRHVDVLRRSFGRLSDDPRIQALVVALCFGALLEALAGFGAPVAICSVMLVALGFDPVRAAVVALVANTAPVAFGARGTPVATLAQVTGVPLDSVASVVGRQTPLAALVVPLVLVGPVDGRRGLRETWVPALVCGVAFAAAQFAASNYVSAQLADIGASLAGAAAPVAVYRTRAGPPPSPYEAAVRTGVRSEDLGQEDPRPEVVRAYAPYALIVVIFSIAQIPPVKDWLAHATRTYDWSFLDVVTPEGKPVGGNVRTLPLVSTGGTLVLPAGPYSGCTRAWRSRKGRRRCASRGCLPNCSPPPTVRAECSTG
ncbi:L-lactate permease [Streptomyces mirabilis]|uniref:L-lactate permease n=1 Tax=Streptomyces mirabilis TaxID=68239 RepID=A0A1I2FTX8_9ACTN|nr:L-lactate permease [Streptomyces mirabilis]